MIKILIIHADTDWSFSTARFAPNLRPVVCRCEEDILRALPSALSPRVRKRSRPSTTVQKLVPRERTHLARQTA